MLGGSKIKIMFNTRKYFIIAFSLIISACDKDTSEDNCLCTISLRGNVWSQFNVSDCSSCIATQGYTANCDCE